MPVNLEAHCKRILDEIIAISQTIRRSALSHANNRNFQVSERLRRQLETIRISADTLLEALTKASVTDWSLDDHIVDWLFSGELPSCLDKLKEMDVMLKPAAGRPRSARPASSQKPTVDILTGTMIFFDKHVGLFHFLITPEVWDSQKLLRHPPGSEAVSPVDAGFIEDVMECDRQSTRVGSVTVVESEHGENVDNSEQLEMKRQKALHQQKLDEVSRWLAALDCTEKHNYTLRMRRQGTCMWFPKTDTYKRWRTGGTQLLWLHGKVGCGKSVLIASTIEYLKNTLQDGEAILFFYCDSQNKRSTSLTELMRSLISQLVYHLCDRGIDSSDLPSKILEEKSNGTLLLDDLDSLRGLLSRTARSLRYEPIIVIDALDECADMEALLDTLVMFNRADVRLLVTSRPHPMIGHRFSGILSLSYEQVANEVAADIALYLGREVVSHNQLRAADSEMRNDVLVKLNKKADGRFRWVKCQLEILKRCATGQELRGALSSLPTELQATYERIIDAIDERRLEGRLARRTLALLVVALRPLRLVEVIDGLSEDLSFPRTTSRNPGWLGARVVEALSSLVSYYEETDKITLSDASVKEYLVCHTTLPTYRINPHVAHAEAAQTCMRYISVFLKNALLRDVSPLESWPMLSYALSSGFNHLAHVDPQSTIVIESLKSLALIVRNHPTHWDRLCELREEDLRWPYPPWPTSRHDFVYYILIAYSSTGLFKTFLSENLLVKPRLGVNPVVYAADLRKIEHGFSLLARGHDVNARGLVVDDTRRVTPLEVAVDLGEDALVGQLVQKGSKVTVELLSTAICMPWCSTRVLAKLMQTDEFVEWAHEIGHEKLYRGIFNSARPNSGDVRRADENHLVLARRLRQVGLDLSPESPIGQELIERAVHSAHTSMLEYLLPLNQPPPARLLLTASTGDTCETTSMIRFLLLRGVNINVVSGRRRDTALHLAAMCPLESRCLELVKTLINFGCNPHVRNVRGETPLMIAMQREYRTVVDYLLSNSSPSLNILLIALQRKMAPSIIQLLIRRGAYMRSVTSHGDTVFHLAIARYAEDVCLNLFKWFVEAGYKPTGRNSEGKTIIDAVTRRGYISVAEFLFSCDVQYSPDVLLSALHHRSPPRMVEFLVRKGIEVNSITYNWDGILRLATGKYAEPVCSDLINILLQAGWKPTNVKKTALAAAINRGYTSVVEVLLSCNVPLPRNILQIALRRRLAPEMVSFLIHKGAEVHRTASNWDTMLHLAIASYAEPNCLMVVDILIHAGCEPTMCNFDGKTALVIAVERGYTSVVERLLSCHVPLPLDILASALERRCPPQLVRLLLRSGANIHPTTREGNSILHLVIIEYPQSVQPDLVRAFLESGCNPFACNAEGKTALITALERGYVSVMEVFRSCNVPFPPDILPVALGKKSAPGMIRLLVRDGASDHALRFRFHWDAIVELVRVSYVGRDLEEVFTILDAARRTALRRYSGHRAEPTQVTKRRRLG